MCGSIIFESSFDNQPLKGNIVFLTKTEAVIISVPILFCYTFPYYLWVSHGNHETFLTLLYFFGVFFLLFRKLEEPEELLFLDRGTDGYWGEGYCLVPNFLPFLRNIGINFPWGLRNSRRNILQEERLRNIDIHHYQDQRDMSYRVNAETSLFAANMNRFFEKLFKWIFSIDEGKPELFYHRIGFRFMLLALILAYTSDFSKSVTKVVNDYTPPHLTQQKESYRVSIQLNNGVLRGFPDPPMFESKGDNQNGKVIIVNDTVYMYYQKRDDGLIPFYGDIPENRCLLIPAGKELKILSQNKPVSAVNMENLVSYGIRYESSNFYQKLWAFGGTFTHDVAWYPTSDTWKHIVDNWDTVEKTKKPLTVKALTKEKMLDSDAGGGVVCY